MGEITHIEWTDHTFNPWEGCTKVSPGCAHCYAETRNQRFSGGANWGKGAPRRRTSVQNWNQPRKWNRAAGERGQLFGNVPWARQVLDRDTHRPRVFCASLADWLDDEVPIEWLADLLRLIHQTPSLDWQLLTKRPQNWRARMEAVCEIDGDSLAWSWLRGNAPANVWIGTTVEDQTRADERIPVLLGIPARVRFLSCEPLLGPLDLDIGAPKWRTAESYHAEIQWVICGGESGPAARPMHPDWARSLRDQCASAGVPFFFKQWGEWQYLGHSSGPLGEWEGEPWPTVCLEAPPLKSGHINHVVMAKRGKEKSGSILDGINHKAFPA